MTHHARKEQRQQVRDLVGFRHVPGLVFLLLFVLLTCPLSAASPLRVEIFHSADSDVQRQVVDALVAALELDQTTPIEWYLRDVDDGLVEEPIPADLRVAIGAAAAGWLAKLPGGTPRLYGFIPDVVWREIQSCCNPMDGKDSALLLDRPFARQLQLAKVLAPSARSVGVLLGPASRYTEESLERAAEQQGLELVVAHVDEQAEVGPALRGILDEVEVLMAVPDSVVFNRQTVYSILLTSYSADLPLVGFSEAMVRAGAAAGLHLTPEDAGYDLAQAIIGFGVTGQLDKTKASPSSSLATNQDVLRSLSISVDVDFLFWQEIGGKFQ